MRISQLTFLGFYLNGAQGSGRYNSISIQDVKTQLAEGTLFEYLQQQLGLDIDLTVFSDEEKAFLTNEWLDMSEEVNETSKFAVEKGGLCLLMAYTLESIQRLNKK